MSSYSSVMIDHLTSSEDGRSWCNGHPRRNLKLATRVQTLDEIICILHSTNTLKKNMDPTSLDPLMNKQSGRLGFLTLMWQLILEKNRFWIQTICIPLKNQSCILLVTEEFGKFNFFATFISLSIWYIYIYIPNILYEKKAMKGQF